MSTPEAWTDRLTVLAPILFATTNIPKLLQARLVLGWHGIEVQRLEAHSRPYTEPYGQPDRAFLQTGINEIRERAGGHRLFFIDDTTVTFPSLSSPDRPEPGRETKEWFAATTHAELLRMLDQAGGSRSVIVKSDIALHVPGVRDAIVFTNPTKGTVAETLEPVTPNRLYPWLGQPDFSSWFIPQGATRVLASMQLEESMRYDFRAAALNMLAERLLEYSAILNLPVTSIRNSQTGGNADPHQLTLFDMGEQKTLFVVIGRMASGKTTIGHYLELYRHFIHIEGSRALTAISDKHAIKHGSSNFEVADRLFADCGFDVVEREFVVPRLAVSDGPIVYTGCRTVEGLATLKQAARDLGWRVYVIYIASPSNLRLSRAVERARTDETLDPMRFEAASLRDEAYGAARFGRLAADVVVRNSSDLNNLLRSIDRAALQLRRPAVDQVRMARGMRRRLAEARNAVDAMSIVAKVAPDAGKEMGLERLASLADALYSVASFDVD